MRRRPGTGLGRAVAALVTLAGIGLAAQAAWIPAKAALAQVLLERAFARTLTEGRSARPWPWADTEPVARLAPKDADIRPIRRDLKRSSRSCGAAAMGCTGCAPED